MKEGSRSCNGGVAVKSTLKTPLRTPAARLVFYVLYAFNVLYMSALVSLIHTYSFSRQGISRHKKKEIFILAT